MTPSVATFLDSIDELLDGGRHDWAAPTLRGIYDTVVYSTKLKLEGSFQPDFAAAGIGVADQPRPRLFCSDT